MKALSKFFYVVLLAPLVFSFAIGQDIFVPEVPELVKIFSTDQGHVQLTLSLFILAVGAGQLLFGPLADQFGRKIIALLSIAIYSLSAVFAATANTIDILIIARIFQGLGACGMMVCAFAIARDVTSGNETGKLISYLNSAIAISPLLAPIIGGYLFQWYGWQAPFLALAIFSAISFIIFIIYYKESLLPEYRIKLNFNLFSRYKHIISNKTFAIYAFCASSTLACFFTFFSVSSYILIGKLQLTPIAFGYYFATVGLTFLFASIIAAKLCEYIGIQKTVIIGCAGLFLTGALMTIWTMFSGTTQLSFMIPVLLSATTGSFAMGASAAGALQPFKEMAGTAAALLGASEFLLATIVASIVMHWPVSSNLSYAYTLLCLGGLSCLLLLIYSVRK